jgi:hypothetical protein
MRVTRLGPALWKLHAAAHPYLLIRLTNLQRPQRFAGADTGNAHRVALSAGHAGFHRPPETAAGRLTRVGVIGLVQKHQSEDDEEGGQKERAHPQQFPKYHGRILTERSSQLARSRLNFSSGDTLKPAMSQRNNLPMLLPPGNSTLVPALELHISIYARSGLDLDFTSPRLRTF